MLEVWCEDVSVYVYVCVVRSKKGTLTSAQPPDAEGGAWRAVPRDHIDVFVPRELTQQTHCAEMSVCELAGADQRYATHQSL